MAKNFPYFKFIATEWLTGDIVFEDYELQGIFINVCAIYWHRNGDVTISEVEKRLKTVRLNSLSPRFISVIDGKISIAFLDEQLIAANHKSKVNSGNGKLGGRPKTLTEKPNANRTLTERKAKKSQLKEEEEKEYKEEYIVFDFKKSLLNLGIEKRLATEWLEVRKKKKLTNTQTAFEDFAEELKKTGANPNTVLKLCVVKSWGGLKADWYKNETSKQQMPHTPQQPQQTGLSLNSIPDIT